MLALTLGGGTKQGLWSDHILQVAMLPSVIIGLINLFDNRLVSWARGFVLLAILVLIIQFLPIGNPSNFPQLSDVKSSWTMWSISPSASMESSLFTISILGFSLFITLMDDHQQERLIRFIFLGFAINLVIGVVLLSFGSRVTIEGLLPFEISSGVFANENHFSSLIYMIIPLIAWRLIATARQPLIFALIIMILMLFQFAIGSRAGIVITATFAAVSFIWFGIPRLPSWVKHLTLLLITLATFAGYYYYIGVELQVGASRGIFFATTWQAIIDHWLTGTGLGSFTLVYPMYEAREQIVYVYANHVHSDYLELLLEMGVMVIPMFGYFAYLIIKNAGSSKLCQAAALSIFAVLLHSVVDYPLRTMAIAIIFVSLTAIIFSQRPDTGSLQNKGPRH